MSKVNVIPVVQGHFGTLYDQRTHKIAATDVVLFFCIPAFAGATLVAARFGFRVDAVNGFLNAFSILTGLLLNLLILVFTLASTTTVTKINPALRRQLLKEVFFNVCFAILVALIVVVTAVVALAYMRSNGGAMTGPCATFLLTASGACFVLTLLMIIKRMFIMMNKELSTVELKQE